MYRHKPSRNELHRLYWDECMTVAQVASHLGVTPRTVNNWMAAYGIPRRRRGQAARPAPDYALIWQLYQQGMRPKAIAAKTYRSIYGIRWILKRMKAGVYG